MEKLNRIICGMNLSGTDYYFQKNMLGDVCAVYSGTGEMVCSYVYDAWGNHKLYNKDGEEIPDDGKSVGSFNPFRYRGYYWDREFGLYYLKSRYYDPEVGRFISPDSIEYLNPASISGMNLYAYCGNNPVMYTDPEGCAEWWEWLLGALVVVGVTALVAVATFTGTAVAVATIALSAKTAGAIISSAVIGAATAGGVSLLVQGTTGNKEIDYGRLAFDTFVGGVSGAVSGGYSSAFKQLGSLAYYGKQIFVNTLIYSGSYLLSSAISGKKPNLMGVFMAAAGGALNGMVSGWNNLATLLASLIASLLSWWEEFWELIFG